MPGHSTPEYSDRTGRGATSGAVFDRTGKYRYHLWRRWDPRLPGVCFVMLNPSTADHVHNDPTITRCVRFAQTWGFGGVDIVNLFAYRSTDSSMLAKVKNPVGVRNDKVIVTVVSEHKCAVLAWGNHGRLNDRGNEVLELIAGKSELLCFGTTAHGQPKHPLYLRNDSQTVTFPFSR
jgi:hypothetical protein